MSTYTQDFDFLRDVAAAVDGVPRDRFSLDTYGFSVYHVGCATIACASGWMCRHPVLSNGFHGNPSAWRDYAARRIGGLPSMMYQSVHEAYDLFDVPRLRDQLVICHKTVFARRVVAYLRKYGQPIINTAYLAKYAIAEVRT